MGTKKILIRNSFWLGAVEVMSKLIMFGVTVSMVRYFGPKEFGIYNLSAAYVSMFLLIADIGITQIATREMAKGKDKTQKYLGNLLSTKLILALVTLLAIYISTYIINSSQARILIMVVGVYQLCQVASGTMLAVFTAWEKMEMVFLTRFSFYLGIMSATWWTISHKGNVVDLAVSYILTTLISILFSIYLISRLKLKIALELDKKFILVMFRESVPLLGTAIVATVFANTDTLLIGKYWGSEKVGFYQAAYKILFAFQSINFINNAIFPRISVLIHEQNYLTLDKLLKIVVGFSFLGLIPMALIITLGRNLIISKIYGEGYLIAGGVMAVLIWVGVVNYFRILLSNLLMAQNKQIYTFYAVLVGMLINLVLNYFLQPIYGFSFAATSLLISEGVILVLVYSLYERNKRSLSQMRSPIR